MPNALTEHILDRILEEVRGEILRDEPLSRHTSWRVGGPADLFAVPEDREDAVQLIALLAGAQIPWRVIGNGTNLLAADAGYRGCIIHTGRLSRQNIEATGEVSAQGGCSFPALVKKVVEAGLGGIERLGGIPGTVGGVLAMNGGAWGQEIGDRVLRVLICDASGERWLDRDALGFGYRSSSVDASMLVLQVDLRLESAPAVSPLEGYQEVLEKRRQSQPVQLPNAGSVFKNPEGAAAWKLIDEAGMRGVSIGGAQVASEHTNFIVNTGDATAADIDALIELVRSRVRNASGIELLPEVVRIGSFAAIS